MTTYYNQHRKAVRLGRELARGGEGVVFETLDAADNVAKIYHQAPAPDKSEKLRVMAEACTDRLNQVAAWPTETLSAAPGGAVVGFLMRKVQKHDDIHIVCGPKTRLRKFPDASYRFLVRVAANLARAYQVVHDHGHVIGDVNSGGACVSGQGTVTLVDCDSFQVQRGAQLFTCDVGIPIYQPPELQLRGSDTYRGRRRTPNFDAFGLAVLIFQTLFLARHPFAGVYTGDGDMAIDDAILGFRFAYARDAAARMMKPPPGSLQLGSVSPEVAGLFEKAFLETGTTSRPSGVDWYRALDAFEGQLAACTVNQKHAYWNGLQECPLCDIERRVGTVLFARPHLTPSKRPIVDLAGMWTEVVSSMDAIRVPDDDSLTALPVPSAVAPVLTEYARKASRAPWVNGCLIATVMLLAVAIGNALPCVLLLCTAFTRRWLAGPPPMAKHELRGDLMRAADTRRALIETLVAHRQTNAAMSAIRDCEAHYNTIKEFDRNRSSLLTRFNDKARDRQLSRYLDGFPIAGSKLKIGGPNVIARLDSFGIQTADDVTDSALQGIRGVGEKRRDALLEWRADLEASFRPIANDPQEAQERARFLNEQDLEFNKLLAVLYKELQNVRLSVPRVTAQIQDSFAQLKVSSQLFVDKEVLCKTLGY